MKEVNAPNCGREGDLIAFLYSELNEVEARGFQRHASGCASCNGELAALREVRESVVTWRNETLGTISIPMTETAVARVDQRQHSALSAVREFFNLAPLWTKSAVAFASILLCLLAGLAIMRLLEQPRIVIVKEPGSGYSETELKSEVERRVQEELERLRKSESQPLPPVVAGNIPDRKPVRRLPNRGSTAFNAPSQKARRPLSKTEREQLAADLRLTSPQNENELDLLDDRINQ